MGQPRVPLVNPGANPELQEIERRIQAERGRISLLYQVLLNSPAIASGWERMLTAVRNQTQVPASFRELIILRVAVLNRADFEFDAHIPHAKAAGVSLEKIQAVRESLLPNIFTEDEHLMLELADTMTRDVQVQDDLMSRLQARLSAQELVEVVATVAAYNMVSRFLVALNVGH